MLSKIICRNFGIMPRKMKVAHL
jgi:hypothetical protein